MVQTAHVEETLGGGSFLWLSKTGFLEKEALNEEEDYKGWLWKLATRNAKPLLIVHLESRGRLAKEGASAFLPRIFPFPNGLLCRGHP